MGSREEGYSRLEDERTERYARQIGNLEGEECKSEKEIQNELFIGAKKEGINTI